MDLKAGLLRIRNAVTGAANNGPAVTTKPETTRNNRAEIGWEAAATSAPLKRTETRRPSIDAGAAGYIKMLRAELNAIERGWESRFMAIAGDAPLDIHRAEQIAEQIIASPSFVGAARAYVQHGHADVLSDIRKSGSQSWGAKRAEDWAAGILQTTLDRVRKSVLGGAGRHAGLRQAAQDSAAGEGALTCALKETVAKLHGAPSGDRYALEDIIRNDIEQLCGNAVDRSVIKDAIDSGGEVACNALLHAIDASSVTSRATVAADAAPGVRALVLPTLSDAKVVSYAGNTWAPVTMRNFAQGGGLGWGDHLRLSAQRAATERRPLRFLEITQGPATNALPFSDQWSVRSFGDYLLCRGDEVTGKVIEWGGAPALAATVVTGPVDMTRTLAAQHKRTNYDEIMKKVASWVGAHPFEDDGPQIVAAYDKRIASGALSVQTGDNYVDTLKRLAAEGKRFDIGVFQQLAWSADRVRIIEALQSVVAVGGEIMIPTQSWAPRSIMARAGVEDIKRFNDTIMIDGTEQPLITWLAAAYPNAFEVRGGAGCEALIVKGTATPVKLPAMDCAATGAVVENELPQARWSIVG